MQLKQRIAAIPQHRLDERESLGLADDWDVPANWAWGPMRGTGEKIRFQQTLAILRSRIGVNDHAAADTHGSARAIELKSPNRNVEGSLPPREEADRARVNAARRVFELGNELRGPHFRRAGD